MGLLANLVQAGGDAFNEGVQAVLPGAPTANTALAVKGAENIEGNPLGALGGTVAVVSAAPVVLIVGSGLVTVGPFIYVGAAGADALGVTHGARQSIDDVLIWVASHPADLGEAIIGSEGIVAGVAGGGAVVGAGLIGTMGRKALLDSLQRMGVTTHHNPGEGVVIEIPDTETGRTREVVVPWPVYFRKG